MPFKKGQSGNPAGRTPGTANHFTTSVRDTVLEVFKTAQDDPELCLLRFLRDNPRDFYALAGKLIPTAIHAELRTPEGIKVTYNADPKCLPLGTDPELHTGILGEQGGLRQPPVPGDMQPGEYQIIEDIQSLPADDSHSPDQP